MTDSEAMGKNAMPDIRNTVVLACVFAFIVAVLGCREGRIYHHYESTAVSGWEKLDTLSFEVPRIKESGEYSWELGLRIRNTYPFMGITLIVDQTLYRKNEFPLRKIEKINCKLIDENGNSYGQGVISWQYHYAIKHQQLKEGDSLSIKIRHDMKREILPGVSDVGIVLRSVAH